MTCNYFESCHIWYFWAMRRGNEVQSCNIWRPPWNQCIWNHDFVTYSSIMNLSQITYNIVDLTQEKSTDMTLHQDAPHSWNTPLSFLLHSVLFDGFVVSISCNFCYHCVCVMCCYHCVCSCCSWCIERHLIVGQSMQPCHCHHLQTAWHLTNN